MQDLVELKWTTTLNKISYKICAFGSCNETNFVFVVMNYALGKVEFKYGKITKVLVLAVLFFRYRLKHFEKLTAVVFSINIVYGNIILIMYYYDVSIDFTYYYMKLYWCLWEIFYCHLLIVFSSCYYLFLSMPPNY